MIRKYAEIFCWKNVSSFCTAKATHIFSAKNIRILYVESAKTVNEMTLNELVKLTTLWTTGPRWFGWMADIADSDQTTLIWVIYWSISGQIFRVNTTFYVLFWNVMFYHLIGLGTINAKVTNKKNENIIMKIIIIIIKKDLSDCMDLQTGLVFSEHN